jgi:sec-independent protein translocase protein TatB
MAISRPSSPIFDEQHAARRHGAGRVCVGQRKNRGRPGLRFELSERCAKFTRVFGFSFGELRNLTSEVRSQTGIDELLRAEGLHGGLNELRGLLRGGHSNPFEAPQPAAPVRTPIEDPYANLDIDVSREYPLEGADSYGALPDDLLAADTAKDDAAKDDTAKSESPAPTPSV